MPQILALAESLRFYNFQRRRDSDDLQPTAIEALRPDVLQSIWELDRPQTLASRERAALDPLQRGRQPNTLQHAALKCSAIAYALVGSQYFKAIGESRGLEALAQRK